MLSRGDLLERANRPCCQSIIVECQEHMCNELGGGRLYSDVTGVGLSGSHKEQQTHSGDGI